MIEQYLLLFPGNSNLESQCHVLVDREERWAVAGQLDDNPGTSVTNALERVAQAIAERWFDDMSDFSLFEYTMHDPVDRVPALYEIRWHGGTFRMPEWTRSDRANRLLDVISPYIPDPYTSRDLRGAETVKVGALRRAERPESQSRSILVGSLDLPSDFPAAEFDSAELHFRARAGTSPVDPSPTWLEFSAAWMALAFRFADAAYFDEKFRESLRRHGTAPALTERHAQERHLFGFFVGGLAAIESFNYGLSAIAWEAGNEEFTLTTDSQRNSVSTSSTLQRFQAHYTNEPVTAELANVLRSTEYNEWLEVRNALAHRASPPRKHFIKLGDSAISEQRSSLWGDLQLDEELTYSRRVWLGNALARLLAEAGRFANDHFDRARRAPLD
jgi:hypothetical protein